MVLFAYILIMLYLLYYIINKKKNKLLAQFLYEYQNYCSRYQLRDCMKITKMCFYSTEYKKITVFELVSRKS